MRRIIALALTVVFALQTTASAAAPGQMHGPNVQPLLAAIENTFVFALITGHVSRYAAMHAPAPTPMPLRQNVTPPAVFDWRSQVRTLRQGVEHVYGPLPRPNAWKASSDPLAMTASANARRGRPATTARGATPPPIARAHAGSTLHAMATYSSSTAPTTGVNPWWTYEEGAIPGVGKDMLNVANGNLLVQSNDVDIPERGIDLAFRRTYNSQSLEGQANADGSDQGIYGEGWTNNFDERLAYDATNNVISVFDLDGARYDYKANGSGGWTPPPGMQGTSLIPDSSADCYYYWQKKNGTLYLFLAPFSTSCNPAADEAGWGRLAYIAARNHHNLIQLYYSFTNNDASSIGNLTQIRVADAGMNLYLGFTTVNGQPELGTLTRPDGQTILYTYDTRGDLTAVTRPGNAADDATRTQTFTTLTEAYGYYAGTHAMLYAASPRWDLSAGTDGDYRQYLYSTNTASGDVTEIDDIGYMNFTPHDGTSTPLQSGTQSYMNWRSEGFSGWGSGTTTFSDSQGHASAWAYDGSGRVTQTQAWSSPTASLLTQASWDANNDLTATVDPRRNETDYAYDTNGNTIAVAQPQVTTSMGTFRPTALYSYDQFNNLTVYCDPIQSHMGGGDWIGSNPGHPYATGDTLCGAIAGRAHYTYYYSDANEPFGALTDTYSPGGYHHHISYDSNDYGLPIEVQGDAITQNDGTVRTPTQTFAYDPYGNLTGYNKGNGAWTLTYDSLNRNVTRQDPDGVTSYTCYNADGTIALQRSASEYAADSGAACGNVVPANSAGVSYVFDPDGNTLTELHHYACTALSGCQSGVITKWYDGEDRLVEVRQPQDGNDAYAFPWMTRYIYDISGGGTQNITGGATGFLAYGNLYKTQECIQGTSVQISGPTTINTPQPSPPPVSNVPLAPTYSSSCTFQDLRGNTFDALDRSLTKYEVAAGTSPEQTSIYDSNGEYGLLSEKTNPTGQTDALSYDADAQLSSEAFTDGVTPNRSYSYDPDGRQTALTSATLGTQTRTYDADGRVTSTTDPSSEQAPDAVTYGYYPDGLRSTLSLNVPAAMFNQSSLFSYNYRADGLRSSLVAPVVGLGNNTFAWTYTNAGRVSTQSDPLNGMATGQGNTGPGPYTIQPKTLTYDSYGRIASLTLPRGVTPKTNITYDLEDKELGASWGSTSPVYFRLSTRNETSGLDQTGGPYANGAVCQQLNSPGLPTGSCTFDARSGQVLSQQQLVTPGGGPSFTSVQQYGYDAAGREVSDGLICGSAAAITETRSYDTDNHIIAQAIPPLFTPALSQSCGSDGGQQALSYTWDASGRLANFSTTSYYPGSTPSQTTSTESAHWDGDDLLYVGFPSGGTLNGQPVYTMELYIEKLGWLLLTINNSGQVVQNTATIYDRDQSGTAINTHGGTSGLKYASFTQLTIDTVHPYRNGSIQCSGSIVTGRNCNFAPGQVPLAAPSGGPSCELPPGTVNGCGDSMGASSPPVLDAARSDGYYDGNIAIQGVRAYDPNMNQWTSPDAYSGDVHDPMSQHPYMWNNNNPVQYSDPSGYFGLPLINAPAPGIKAITKALGDFARSVWNGFVHVSDGMTSFIGGNSPLDKVPGESAEAPTVLQTGGNTLKTGTIKALGMTRSQANQAMHALKKENGLANDYHSTKIMSNGEVIDAHSGNSYGNLNEYKPGNT